MFENFSRSRLSLLAMSVFSLERIVYARNGCGRVFQSGWAAWYNRRILRGETSRWNWKPEHPEDGITGSISKTDSGQGGYPTALILTDMISDWNGLTVLVRTLTAPSVSGWKDLDIFSVIQSWLVHAEFGYNSCLRSETMCNGKPFWQYKWWKKGWQDIRIMYRALEYNCIRTACQS